MNSTQKTTDKGSAAVANSNHHELHESFSGYAHVDRRMKKLCSKLMRKEEKSPGFSNNFDADTQTSDPCQKVVSPIKVAFTLRELLAGSFNGTCQLTKKKILALDLKLGLQKTIAHLAFPV